MQLTPATARTTLVGIRSVLAVGTWAAPDLSGRLFGISMTANPAGPYLGQLFGTREAYLAAESVLSRGEARRRAVRRQVAVDAADVVGALVAQRQGWLPTRAAVLAGGTAALAVALGVIAAQE